MTLTLIEKYRVDAEGKVPCIKIKRELTHREQKLLTELFVLDGLLMDEDRKEIITLCKSIHARDWWVQCGCVKQMLKPVFRFNRASSGKLYLHHITSRGNHAQHCVFKEREWSTSTSPLAEKPRIKETAPLNLVSKKSYDVLPKNDKKIVENSGTGRSRHAKLARAMYRLLDDAGVNVIQQGKEIRPLDAIKKAASRIEIQPKKSMADYLYTHPALLWKANNHLRNDNSWVKDVPKHALMLVSVQSFDEHTIEAYLPNNGGVKRLTIANRIYRASGRFSLRTAPFMALLLITESPEKAQDYVIFNAFIMPSYSKDSFVPVDSHYEREMLKRLYAVQREYANLDKHFIITKPLHDIRLNIGTDEEISVLPDFIIETNHQLLVIEVNGSHEPEYLDRKARVHESMKALGTVLSFDAYMAEKDNRLSQGITEFIMKIKTQINKG